ncbi:MAG: hypothetical protein ACYC3I_09705 [Gemmataceae bacterium]
MHNETTAGSDLKAAHAADANGTSEQQTDTTSADEARRQAMQRAEEMVDRWGEQIGQYFSAFGHNVLKWTARAREEAEDIWAEAQAIRQRNQKS